MPTLLQRQGIFTRRSPDDVPVIYDPATTVGRQRTPFPGNTIPAGPHGSGRAARCCSAIRCRPRPGTANNYRRTANEIDDQDQWDVRDRPPVRVEPRSGVRPALVLPRRLRSGDAAARRQRRHDRHARAAGHDRVGVRVELPAHVLGNAAERAAHRRHAPHASIAAATQLLDAGGIARSASRAFRRTRSFPTRCRRSSIGGYQQLGSPPNTASDFNTSVIGSRRLADVAEGPPHAQDGARLAVGAAQRHPAAVADRLVHVQHASAATCRVRPTPARRSRASCSARCRRSRSTCSTTQIQERAHFQEYFIQDDWKISDRLTVNAGLRYTLNFPSTEINGQTAVFNLQTQQLEYPGDEAGARRCRRTTSARASASSIGSRDKTVVSSGYGLVWIEMAGITTPFTTPSFPFLQTVVAAHARQHHAGVRAAERPERRADRADADAGPRPGRVRRRRHASARATCSSGTCRCSAS